MNQFATNASNWPYRRLFQNSIWIFNFWIRIIVNCNKDHSKFLIKRFLFIIKINLKYSYQIYCCTYCLLETWQLQQSMFWTFLDMHFITHAHRAILIPSKCALMSDCLGSIAPCIFYESELRILKSVKEGRMQDASWEARDELELS